jgi:hypothetical protein
MDWSWTMLSKLFNWPMFALWWWISNPVRACCSGVFYLKSDFKFLSASDVPESTIVELLTKLRESATAAAKYVIVFCSNSDLFKNIDFWFCLSD